MNYDDILDCCAFCGKPFKPSPFVDGHIAWHFVNRHWNLKGGIRGSQ